VEQDNKLHFFKRIKVAIFNLEDYGKFLGESGYKAVKYFLLLILLFSCIFGFSKTFYINKGIKKVYNYINNELPSFEYNSNKLHFSQKVEAFDEEFKVKLFIDTDNISQDVIKNYKSRIYDEEWGLILLEDRMLIIYDNNDIVNETYSILNNIYELNFKDKNELIELLNSNNNNSIIFTYFIIITIVTFIFKIISTFFDLIMIAIFGYFVAIFCKIRFKWQAPTILAVYSLTLSIVLNAIYSLIYTFTGFEIRYFDAMYILLAYVYIIAAIFMIRTDIIRDATELQKIYEAQVQIAKEQEQVDEENNKEDENKEKKDTKDEENDKGKKEDDNNQPDVNNREPDGSEI